MEREPLLVGKKTAAQILGISARSVDYLIERGELKPRRIGRRVLLLYKDLQAFVRRDHPNQE